MEYARIVVEIHVRTGACRWECDASRWLLFNLAAPDSDSNNQLRDA